MPLVDEDLLLPKVTVLKMISEICPKGISHAKETRDLIIECCIGELLNFHFIASLFDALQNSYIFT
ncbi:hypothetical protein K439DRAFT_1346519 [Ramaria rubella]|nr:hypothetical protein K439DRAFT_1346519 [Ramaria rubella]